MIKQVLVVYFSRTGNNKKIATKTKEYLNCDIDEIIDLGGKNIITGIFAVIFKKKTKIMFEKDPEGYNFLIIVTPVWVGTIPPAVRAYILKNREKIKKIAILSISGNGKKNEKLIPEIEFLINNKTLTNLLLTEKEFIKGNYKDKFKEFLQKVENIN